MTRLLCGCLLIGVIALSATPASGGGEKRAVPDFRARDLDGRKFDLEETLRDGPAVVTFWATWCKPCRKELPELEKLLGKYGDRGLQIVGVNGDGPVDQAKIRPYVRALGFDFTVIPDGDGEIRRRFQVEVFPTTFVIDREGRIAHRQVGYRQGDEARIEAAIRELLPEPPPPEAPPSPGSAKPEAEGS